MKAPQYRLPTKLEHELRRLYGGDGFQVFLYGIDGIPNEWKPKDLPGSVPVQARGKYLMEWIEGYLQLKVDEFDEYDDPEQTARLRAESTGMLKALREALRHLLGVFTPYKLPAKLEHDLRRLYGNTDFKGLLRGSDVVPDEWKSKDRPNRVPLQTRGQHLIEQIEKHLQQNVDAADKYGDLEQTDRLCEETTGMLIGLRETLRHVPELLLPATKVGE